MEKTKADAIITKYLKKIYGFAHKKSFSYEETEELAAEMTAKVYQSILSQSEVYNLEGYIWRICENTYAKYDLSAKRNKGGVSIDEMEDIPYFEVFADDDGSEEISRLKREIAFLSSQRRDIVFRFYYNTESIKSIASDLRLPKGTVKWHLNKARNELKGAIDVERKIGELGLQPVEEISIGHSGKTGRNGGPEYYLNDRINLNIVYSVYYQPKNIQEIAEELGMTPVFIEEKVKMLENNGFIVRTKNNRFTTYVLFSPRKYSKEQRDNELMKKHEAAKMLLEEYVPAVREAVADKKDVYIPGENRELLEAAAIFYGIVNNCSFDDEACKCDLSKYYISTLDGGEYIAFVDLKSQCLDPEYEMEMNGEYWACGNMWRSSKKYPAVKSWAIDSRFDSRGGGWKNNLYTDYEYLYEFMTGRLSDQTANAEKINRLKERGFIDDNDRVQIIVYKGTDKDFQDRIPQLDKRLKRRFADYSLENSMQQAKGYPVQMQDLIVTLCKQVFSDQATAVMVLEMLYDNGVFKPLTDKERVAANLIMFSDVLPGEKLLPIH